jgi:hypothetical protein
MSASTVVLTFDNLGEASELERGSWSQRVPLGRDPSVLVALPRLLDELERRDLPATFFVEAINCEIYPEALREIAARGYEVAVHGWRHEHWAKLSPERERAALSRGARAFRALGLDVSGFRPPGGELTARSPALLREVGLTWCSPAGAVCELRDGLAFVPFDWTMVDAYHLMPRFAELRVARGDHAEVLAAGDLLAQLSGRIESLAAPGETQTLILHPFLMLDDAWFEAVRHLLDLLAGLRAAGRIQVQGGGRFADLLRRRDVQGSAETGRA